MDPTSAWYALGALAVVAALLPLRPRRELSLAKHPSPTGHARIARALARRLAFHEYDEASIFEVDGAPAKIAAQRRAAFARLAALYRTRSAATSRLTVEVAPIISDLQFTGAYRTPFQFSRYVREHLNAGAFACTSS